MGNWGPITGCLILTLTKYKRYNDACVRLSFPDRCKNSCNRSNRIKLTKMEEYSISVVGTQRWQGNMNVIIINVRDDWWLIRFQNNSCPVTRLRSNCILLLFSSWHPVVRSVVGRDFPRLFTSSSLSSRFSHYISYQQSPIPSICCSFLSSSPALSRFLLMQSAHHTTDLPASFIAFLSFCSLYQFSISHSFHNIDLFQLTPRHFLL